MVDLIFSNENKEDIDVIREFEIDLAYGADENNFVLSVPLKENEIEEHFIIYIENTEYGGIIDSILANTGDGKIEYKGRTWHGILAGKIVEPPDDSDYLLLNGEANEVIQELIDLCGLSDIFTVSTIDSGIYIVNYECRYIDLYSALKDMLFGGTGKLKIEHKGINTVLSAIPYIDYSQNEEWDSSQLIFEAEKNYRPVNHIIALGQGELKDRKVIHIFSDANGGVQDYANVSAPVTDSDYILTKENQVLFGKDEVSEILDSPDAQTVKNYVLLTEKPSDFDIIPTKYFTKSETGDSYTQNEITTEDAYSLLTTQPADWLTRYERYYYLNSGNYNEVEGVETDSYVIVSSQPTGWGGVYSEYYYYSGGTYNSISGVDETIWIRMNTRQIKKNWKKNYSDYYIRTWNGVEYVYTKVDGVDRPIYKVQTAKPSDWNTNYADYYKKREKESGYEAVQLVNGKVPKWVAKRYYTKYSNIVAPAIPDIYLYIPKTQTVAPAFSAATVYEKRTTINAPTFTTNTYYRQTIAVNVPKWFENTYYEYFEDNYANLVEKSLELMQKYYNCDKIDVELNPDTEYDIGDVVGATETITGLSVWQPITKKIVTINKTKKTIKYEIGVS